MESQVGRRAFVGVVAAGLPLLATATVARGQTGHDHGSSQAGNRDPVIDHVVRELGAIHRRVRGGSNRGEDARAAAAHIRTLGVYLAGTDFNARVKKALKDRTAKQGRDQLLYTEIDLAATVRELRHYGIEVTPAELYRPIAADHATRSQALDEALAGGLAPALKKLAASFEATGADLDRSGPNMVRRARYWGNCNDLADTIAWLEIEAALMCALSVMLPAAGPACAILSSSWAIYSVYYRLNCT